MIIVYLCTKLRGYSIHDTNTTYHYSFDNDKSLKLFKESSFYLYDYKHEVRDYCRNKILYTKEYQLGIKFYIRIGNL